MHSEKHGLSLMKQLFDLCLLLFPLQRAFHQRYDDRLNFVKWLVL